MMKLLGFPDWMRLKFHRRKVERSRSELVRRPWNDDKEKSVSFMLLVDFAKRVYFKFISSASLLGWSPNFRKF